MQPENVRATLSLFAPISGLPHVRSFFHLPRLLHLSLFKFSFLPHSLPHAQNFPLVHTVPKPFSNNLLLLPQCKYYFCGLNHVHSVLCKCATSVKIIKGIFRRFANLFLLIVQEYRSC